MKKLLLLIISLFSLSFMTPATSQDLDEEMINAQLRFIKENARLTKKEYQRFAKIYLEYNKQLYELNKEQREKIESQQNVPQVPFGGFVPFGPGHDRENQNVYMKRWNEINSLYLEKLEKNLPDSTREKIGVAQWELGLRIWKQWSEQNEKIMSQQMEEMRKRNEKMWNQVSEQQRQWWDNYWKQWQNPKNAEDLRGRMPVDSVNPWSQWEEWRDFRNWSQRFDWDERFNGGQDRLNGFQPRPWGRPGWGNWNNNDEQKGDAREEGQPPFNFWTPNNH